MPTRRPAAAARSFALALALTAGGTGLLAGPAHAAPTPTSTSTPSSTSTATSTSLPSSTATPSSRPTSSASTTSEDAESRTADPTLDADAPQAADPDDQNALEKAWAAIKDLVSGDDDESDDESDEEDAENDGGSAGDADAAGGTDEVTGSLPGKAETCDNPARLSQTARQARTLAATAALDAAAGGVESHQALPADCFTDSLGVGTHLTYGNTPYADQDMVAKRLQELGFRHLRDGWGTGSSQVSSFVDDDLAPLGIGITMVQDPRQNADPEALKDMIKKELPTAIDAVEGQNENDLTGGDWASETREWTRQVAEAYDGDPATKDIPILAPSLADTNTTAKYEALGDLSDWVDYGVAHDYPGNQWVMNESITDTVLKNNRITAGDVPVQVTETGYTNGSAGGGYPGTPEAQVTEQLPKLFLDHFRQGIARTFTYELLDEKNDGSFEGSFGLLKSDGTPKPSFETLRELVTLTSDPGKGAGDVEASLAYHLDGVDEDTRTLLLGRRDGSFVLAVYQQEPTWDGSKVRTLAARQMTLTLGQAADVRVDDLDGDDEAVTSTQDTTTMTFNVQDGVNVLTITPTGASTSTNAPETDEPTASSSSTPTLTSSSSTPTLSSSSSPTRSRTPEPLDTAGPKVDDSAQQR
ncbi:hypothetical protein [Kineococcus rubinsiae]|uniref:hypothetical protein n=1 Tax=Kineococcus rubinsiae TaxID=2609562 RepID=UPI001430BE85|nr:hypothetical protein [Kineococcus rubinsiae]NIZ91731.1 hypothetical protein [Kineococcus rubinsiae]